MRSFSFLLIACTALAQGPSAADAGKPVALVRFQVAPQKGKPVTDLRAEEIEIRENGEPRKVVILESGSTKPREIPIEISLLFDCDRMALSSGSLNPKIFEEGLLNEFPNASVSIYGFSPGLSRLAPSTRQQAELTKAIDSPLLVHPLSTFLMDHISRVMLDAGSTPGVSVRMLVVVSTGQTDQGNSSATAQQERYERAVLLAQRANISAYPVVLIAPMSTTDASVGRSGGRSGGSQTSSSELSSTTIMRGVGNYGNLGPATGGKKFEVLSGGNMLTTMLKAIADEMRNDYVAGFEASISGADKPKPRKIEVVLRNKDRGRISTPATTLVY